MTRTVWPLFVLFFLSPPARKSTYQNWLLSWKAGKHYKVNSAESLSVFKGNYHSWSNYSMEVSELFFILSTLHYLSCAYRISINTAHLLHLFCLRNSDISISLSDKPAS